MIKVFIVIVFIALPVVLIYLDAVHLEVEGRYFFTTFIVIAAIERIWETFYTPKGNAVRQHHGDWSLVATVFAYFLVSLLMIIQFYNIPIKNIYFVILGLFLFIIACLIRFNSIRSLGENWSIHLVKDLQKSSHNIISREGPYKYIRHPIYLAAIFELFGLAFITNAFFYLIIIFLINTPLYIWRALKEEKINIMKFGDGYKSYMGEVSFFIPLKAIFKK